MNLNSERIGKLIENLNDNVIIKLFEQLSKSFNNHIIKYKKNSEIHTIGQEVVNSINYVTKCLSCYENKNIENIRIKGYTITKFAENICSLKYNKISEILDYLRFPLTNYLETPSKLLLAMWNKTNDLKDLELILT